MLDEFSAAKPAPSKEPETASGPGRPGGAVEDEPGLEGELSDEEFAQQLQAGMADLLGEIENTVGLLLSCLGMRSIPADAPQPEVQAQFETIFKEIGAAAADAAAAAADETPSGPSAEPSRGAAGVNAEASFQETIRKTMERMQTSGDKATAAAAAGDGSDDLLAELMKQMQAGGLEAEGGEEDFSKMLLGMMEQLTNKEILYEPMKELADKYPAWLEKNRSSLPADDLRRYEEQQGLAQEMVAKFEEAAYSDTNAQDREYIVERMHKVGSVRAVRSYGVDLRQTRLTRSLCRCKRRDRHLPIWWETWRARRKPSARPTSPVTPSSNLMPSLPGRIPLAPKQNPSCCLLPYIQGATPYGVRSTPYTITPCLPDALLVRPPVANLQSHSQISCKMPTLRTIASAKYIKTYPSDSGAALGLHQSP